MSKRLMAMAGSAFFLLAGAALAQSAPHDGHGKSAPTAAAEMSEATIKKLDAASGKLTLTHGPLKNLGMPAMTMSFKVKDPAALGRLKEGDRIRFVAEQSGNDFLATRIEKQK